MIPVLQQLDADCQVRNSVAHTDVHAICARELPTMHVCMYIRTYMCIEYVWKT